MKNLDFISQEACDVKNKKKTAVCVENELQGSVLLDGTSVSLPRPVGL